MTIGELARAVGLRPSALRYYESVGLLPAPPRVSGRRVYAREALERLRLVLAAQQAGFTLREIRGLAAALDAGAAPADAWHARAHVKLEELDAAIARMRSAKRLLREVLACGCASLDECRVVGRLSGARGGGGRRRRAGARA